MCFRGRRAPPLLMYHSSTGLGIWMEADCGVVLVDSMLSKHMCSQLISRWQFPISPNHLPRPKGCCARDVIGKCGWYRRRAGRGSGWYYMSSQCTSALKTSVKLCPDHQREQRCDKRWRRAVEKIRASVVFVGHSADAKRLSVDHRHRVHAFTFHTSPSRCCQWHHLIAGKSGVRQARGSVHFYLKTIFA
jgi:hypothetical protein